MVSLRALAGLVKALIYCAAVPSAFTPPEKPTAGADLGAPSLGVRTRTSAGQGALVERVFRQGPADRAGVRPGDVITDLGGSSIRSDPQYNSALAHATVGVPLTLKVSRGGQTETLTVVAERAIPLYTRLCDASDLDACGTIGYMLSNGVRVPRDPARGELLLQKACDGGNLPACVNLGSLLEDELPSGPEPARAARPYEKACTGGVMAGCVNLGRLLRSGRGVPQDVARAIELYHLACAAGDADTCRALGRSYLSGNGVPVDPARARSLLERACGLGSERACTDLGGLR